MHALIVGDRQVGKSTLIRQVLQTLHVPLCGYETKKEDTLADPIHGSPVYIYDAGAPHRQTTENLLGYCKNRCPEVCAAAFDRYAPKLRALAPAEGVILMDEIGFMESASRPFCDAVMAHLDGDVPVIAAVKHNDTPFLNAVRGHPNCRCFSITVENRDALLPALLSFVHSQIR